MIFIRRKTKPSVIIFCVVFCVVVIGVLIGINLLINSSKSAETATQDEITSAAISSILPEATTVEASTASVIYQETSEHQETTKSTEKETKSSNSSKSSGSKDSHINKSSSDNENEDNINSQSHYSDSNSENNNYYNYQPKKSQTNSISNSKSSSSRTNSSSKSPQSSAKPAKPTQPAPKPKPTQAPANNIYLSYSSITVSQGDVVFLSLIGVESGVSWNVNNSSVLINYGGGGNQCSFKAVSKGTAVVTASYNGTSYSCTVKVN